MFLQALWMILTFGIYSIYWFYATCQEMSDYLSQTGEKRNDEITLWTVLLFLPFVGVYSMYKQGELYEIISNKSVDRWIILMLWVFFPPGVWFIIQRKLNVLSQTALPPVDPSVGQIGST
jgi:hypothetical protein